LLHNILRFWSRVSRAGHLGSVGMIMRILTTTVVVFIVGCAEQIVWVDNVWYLSATGVLESSPQHGIHCLGSCSIYSMPRVTGLVAGLLRPQRFPSHPLQTTKADSSHYSTLYNKLFYAFKFQGYFGHPGGAFSNFRFSFRNEQQSLACFDSKRQQTDREYWPHVHWLCTGSTGWTYLISS